MPVSMFVHVSELYAVLLQDNIPLNLVFPGQTNWEGSRRNTYHENMGRFFKNTQRDC